LRDRRGYPRVGGTGRLYQQLGRLERENAALREQVDRRQHANQQLQARVRKLTGQVEELPRAAKRQAAPFSNNTPAAHPRRPGRKPGAAYGLRARRPVPQRVDRVVRVGLPAAKVARLLGQLGLQLTPGGVVGVLHRATRRARPTWDALVGGIRASPVVAPDETGWRVAGRRAWLWAFAGQGVVVYRIAQGRGFDDAAVVLGSGSAGCWNTTGGRRIGGSPPPTIRAVWRTCCVAAVSCWPTPSAARPRPPLRSGASSRLGWRHGMAVSPANWTPPR
jgi:Transposase IS66 family